MKLSRFLRENNINISQNAPTNPVINTTLAHPTSHDQPWMFDAGTSHHVTSDHSSLHTLLECEGPDVIVFRKGTTLPISHTGHTNLTTHTRPLTLSNVFYVPPLRNNLISVAKLSKSNQVSVEFFPYHFLVKDLHTRAHLMRRINVNDFYYPPPLCTLLQNLTQPLQTQSPPGIINQDIPPSKS